MNQSLFLKFAPSQVSNGQNHLDSGLNLATFLQLYHCQKIKDCNSKQVNEELKRKVHFEKNNNRSSRFIASNCIFCKCVYAYPFLDKCNQMTQPNLCMLFKAL